MMRRFVSRVLAVALLVSAGCAAARAEGTAALTDAEIETAFAAGCSRAHRIEHYRGVGNRHQVIGPLWLEKPGEDPPRGVILPPFLRVFLEGRSRRCKKFDVEALRPLAEAEIWVVLWRHEDPPSPPFRSYTTSDQKVLRPTEVRHRADDTWHQPLWTRSEDRWILRWFAHDWNEKESLLASFAQLDETGALHVDYKVEENGRSYLRESAVFPLTSYSKTWWTAAFGEAP